MSRDHGLAVAFAVCSSRLNGRKGFQRQVTYGKVFLPLKIVQPRVLRHQVAFFICLRCACWIIELDWAIKVFSCPQLEGKSLQRARYVLQCNNNELHVM